MGNWALLAAAAGHAVAEHGEHAEPMAFGFITPGMWVALSMTAFIGIVIWQKVPGAIAGGLDKKIAAIREQLDAAQALRAEAEALRAEYAAKIAGAEADAAAMIEHAKHEAQAIITKAEADTTQVIARREKMATDKIAAAERAALDDLRARAATAAATAAGQLIAAHHGASADKALVDSAIAGLAN